MTSVTLNYEAETQFSAAIRCGLIEAFRGFVAMQTTIKFSAAIRCGLIEAEFNARTLAAASYLFSAAIRCGLIEA